MSVTPRHRQLIGQSLYILSGLGLIVFALLPLAPGSIRWPGPDWLLALTFVWLLRRPEQASVLAIAALMLTSDIMTMQPIGLGAALAVVFTEIARKRQQRWADQGLLAEWLRVAALLAMMMVAERVLHTIFFIPATLAPLPPLGQDMMRLIATVAAYPLMVGITRLFGLRRASFGEMELV